MEKDILRNFGLSDNEAQIYLALLKIGSSTPATIAERSGIYRPYVYDTLKRLQEKGMVSSIKKEGKICFSAIHPEKLLEMEEEFMQEFQKIIPSLEKYIAIPKEETKAELYSGKKIVRVVQKDVLNTLLNEGAESLVIGVDEKKFMEADPIIMKQFFSQMKKNKLKERVLVREGDNYLPGHSSTTAYKFLSKEFFEPTSTFIYGNKVAIVIFGEPMHGIIIESKLLANTYRKQFNLLWKIAKTKK